MFSKRFNKHFVVGIIGGLLLGITAVFNYDVLFQGVLHNDISSIINDYNSSNCVYIDREGTITEYNSINDAIKDIDSNENVVIKLQKDVRLSSVVTIPANRNITIDGNGEYSILYGVSGSNYYSGRFFDIKAGSTLNLVNLSFDGENNWLFNEEYYNESLENVAKVTDNLAFISGEEGAPLMKTTLINNSGNLNIENTSFKNFYSNNGCYFVSGANGSITNVYNTQVINNASTGTIFAYITGATARLNVYEGTVISDNYVGSNGGIFKTYSGAITTFNDGVVKNTRSLDTNGVVSMTYGTNSSFILNGGVISNNSGVQGKNNGRNAPIYIHNGSKFIMNGGVIENNRGTSCGGVDAPGHATSGLKLNGGVLRNNQVRKEYEPRSDLNVQYDYDLVIGKDMVIDGNIQVYGDIVNNGVITGEVNLRLESKEDDLKTISGEGTINGDVVVYHPEDKVPEAITAIVNGYTVNCDHIKETVVKFIYNGGTDNSAFDYKLVDVFKERVEASPVISRVGYSFSGWYLDQELTEKWDNEQVPASMILYASWTINQHNVTWRVDGVDKVETYTYGDVINKPEDPKKNNFIFSGWSDYSYNMTLPDNDLLFVANWQPVLYKVNFDSNGGSYVYSISEYYGNVLKLPNAPTALCKNFAGWYYDKEFNKMFTAGSKVLGNTTLYAKWNDNHVWGDWDWHDEVKHVRNCINDSLHLQLENHQVDESGYCTICRNYNYVVNVVEEEVESSDDIDNVTTDNDDSNPSEIKFNINGNSDRFVKIVVDGKTVDKSMYFINDNHEIILSDKYIKKLCVGTHNISVVYEDGEASCEFEVNSKKIGSDIKKVEKKAICKWCWIIPIIILLLILIIILLKRRKEEKE